MKRFPVARAGFLLLLLISALAGPSDALTTVVDATVRSGETIAVDGQSFAIYLSSDKSVIIADYGAGVLSIRNNSCDSTMVARICLDNVVYDTAERMYKLKVRGVSLAPSITVTREVTKKEFLAGEAVTFSVTLKNTGGFARNITYEDLFPGEFEITGTENIPLRKDRAVWKGTLSTDEAFSFSYTVRALSAFDGSLAASVSYADGLRVKKVYSSQIGLKVAPPVVLETILGDAAIIAGEPDNITINITNRLPETAAVRVEVSFDPGLKVVSRPYDARNSSLFVYGWSGLLTNPNKTANLSRALFFEFKGANVGNSGIKARVFYRPLSEPSERELPESRQSVLVSNKGVIVRTSLKDSTFEANQRKSVRVWVQNLNPYVSLSRVFVNSSTGLLDIPDSHIAKLGAGEQVLLADRQFYAPDVSASTGYILSTNVSYFTEFGDNFSASFRDTATVVPSQEVSLAQSLSKSTAKPDEEIDVSVDVKSLRLANLKGVRVFDNLSREFSVIGKNAALLEVKSKETVRAYSYRIKAPHVRTETVFFVNTTVEYSESFSSEAYLSPRSYVLSKATPVTVQPGSFSLSISRTIGDSAIYAGEMFDVKYVITNPDAEKTARNILLRAPVSYEIDLAGGQEAVSLSDLEPGESIVLSASEKRRAKLPGQFELQPAVLDYENSYGDRYSANSSALSIAVKDNYIKGPVILLEKVAPGYANNTDDFVVVLNARNIGTEPVVVDIDDAGRKTAVMVENGAVRAINSTVRIATPGRAALPRAKASYSFNGVLFRTGSGEPIVEIADSPVLDITKEAPSNVTNVEPYAVLLAIRNRASEQIENITVSDGERSWKINAVPAGGHANITYDEAAASAGLLALPPASASYVYDGLVYNAMSNSLSVNVAEKNLVSVMKAVTPENAAAGSMVRIAITARNLHSGELDVEISDGGKSFSALLMPGEEKRFAYDAAVGNETANPAHAAYSLNGRRLTASSLPAGFALTSEVVEESDGESEKGGIFSSLLKGIIKVLTWKRGG